MQQRADNASPRRLTVAHLGTFLDHFGKQFYGKARKGTFQENVFFGRRAKCSSRGDDSFQVGDDSFRVGQDVRPRRPYGAIWKGKLKAKSKKHNILDHTLG